MALWFPALRVAALLLGIAALFLASGTFSIAGRTARALGVFRGAQARVLAWGQPLPTEKGVLYVESVAALGVGLLIRLQTSPGAPALLLKIAQPRDVLVSMDRVVIGRAAYVQWSGRRLARTASDSLPALVLEKVASVSHADSGAPAA